MSSIKFRVTAGEKEIFIQQDTPMESIMKQLISMNPSVDMTPKKLEAARATAVKMRSQYPQSFPLEQGLLGIEIEEIRK